MERIQNPCNNSVLRHLTVNNYMYYKDPITGMHTRIIKKVSNCIKGFIKPRCIGKNFAKDHLLHTIWKRNNNDGFCLL